MKVEFYRCPHCHTRSPVGQRPTVRSWTCPGCHNRLLTIFVRREPETITEPPPKPFTTRLARYLHCDEQELAHSRPPHHSKMNIWCRVSTFVRHRPKPAWLIRLLLERIRRLVGTHGTRR